MIEVFTHKRISPNCPFKSNQRASNFFILTPRCAGWLPGVMHGAQLKSALGWRPQSLTPPIDAHRRAFSEIRVTWLHGVMHIVELDSAVRKNHTAESDYRYFKNVCFLCFQRKWDIFGLGIAIFYFSSEVEHFLHQYSVGPLWTINGVNKIFRPPSALLGAFKVWPFLHFQGVV